MKVNKVFTKYRISKDKAYVQGPCSKFTYENFKSVCNTFATVSLRMSAYKVNLWNSFSKWTIFHKFLFRWPWSFNIAK